MGLGIVAHYVRPLTTFVGRPMARMEGGGSG